MTEVNERLERALRGLDPRDNSHWTQEGLPRLDVLRRILRREISRDEIPEWCVRDKAPVPAKVYKDLADQKESIAQEAARLQRELARITAEQDAIAAAQEAARPLHDNQLTIMQFIEEQKRLPRNGPAPIDRAFARPTARGQKRPVRHA